MPGATIKIYLADGTPLGLRVIEKSNWTGRGFDFARAEWPKVRARDDFGRPGVYVLRGLGEDGQVRVYVGEADELRTRINQHYGGPGAKEFWDRAVVFASKDENLPTKEQVLAKFASVGTGNRDTFVLDFRNAADDITEAFRPWYETTVAVPTDPNLLHDLADRLLALQVLDQAEAHAVAARIVDRTQKISDHGAVYALLEPAVERFRAKNTAEQDEARAALDGFVRAYAFLSQVVDFGDIGFEALYLASRALLSLLRVGDGGRLDLGSEVELTHLRMEKTSEGSITPDKGVAELKAIYAGTGPEAEPAKEHLSAIISVLNEHFGTNLGPADQLFFDQLETIWLADEHLVEQARANPIESFRLVFADTFLKTIVGRMDDNADIYRRILDDPSFQGIVREHYLNRVYGQARSIPGHGSNG